MQEEKATGRKVAVKVIARPIPKSMVSRIETEIAMQTRLGAQCTAVVEAYDAVLTTRHLALSMEVAAGGSLTDYVTARFGKGSGKTALLLSEPEACYFYRQFVQAVSFCHDNHIAHRDLKLVRPPAAAPAPAAPAGPLCAAHAAAQPPPSMGRAALRTAGQSHGCPQGRCCPSPCQAGARVRPPACARLLADHGQPFRPLAAGHSRAGATPLHCWR